MRFATTCWALVALGLAWAIGCGQPTGGQSLREARQGFQTRIVASTASDAVEEPPPSLFRIVHYDSPAGRLPAYLSVEPRDGKRHPAIVWITGGDCNSIGDVWSPQPRTNDQSAAAYRQKGIVMLFPSLRGGNKNPGQKEGFFGEVDDVIAAADFLAAQPYVDSARIYLGGHSTGGTLALLVAECSARYRAVFSFGPVDVLTWYPGEYTPFDTSNPREMELRAPIRWLHSIDTPVFVFEGTEESNLECLEAMQRVCANPQVHFFPVRGADHFSVLAPTNELIAARILEDTEREPNLAFTKEEINRLFAR